MYVLYGVTTYDATWNRCNPFEDVIPSERTPKLEREIANHPSLKPQSPSCSSERVTNRPRSSRRGPALVVCHALQGMLRFEKLCDSLTMFNKVW